MAFSPDRVYEVGQRFPLFPNPQFKEIRVVMAYSDNVDTNQTPEPDPLDVLPVSTKSRFLIKAPFVDRPIPLTANASSPMTHRDIYPPKFDPNELVVGAHNWNHDLTELGLNQRKGLAQEGYSYTQQNRTALEGLIMVVFDAERKLFSSPHIEDYYQSGLRYSRFLDLGTKPVPDEMDLKRFLDTAKDQDILKVARDLNRLAAMEAVFYSINKH